MAQRAFPSDEHADASAPPLVSRLQARFEELDAGSDPGPLIARPPAGPTGGDKREPAFPTRAGGRQGVDDLSYQLEVLREQLDEAFDDVEQRLDAAETRASVAEARASVAEARASVAETRANDAEARAIHADERIGQVMAMLEALAPEPTLQRVDAAEPTTLRSALDRLRDRLEA